MANRAVDEIAQAVERAAAEETNGSSVAAYAKLRQRRRDRPTSCASGNRLDAFMACMLASL